MQQVKTTEKEEREIIPAQVRSDEDKNAQLRLLKEIADRQKEIEYCAKVTRERSGWICLFTAIIAAAALAIAILLFS